MDTAPETIINDGQEFRFSVNEGAGGWVACYLATDGSIYKQYSCGGGTKEDAVIGLINAVKYSPEFKGIRE